MRAQRSEIALCVVVTLRRVAARSAVIDVCSSAPVAAQRPCRTNDPGRLSAVLAAALALLAEALKGVRDALESILALLEFICDGNAYAAEDRLQQAIPELIALPVAAMPSVASFLRAVLERPYLLAAEHSSCAAAACRLGKNLCVGVAAVRAAVAALPLPPRQPAGALLKVAAPAAAAGGEADARRRAPRAVKKARTGARS